MSVKLAVGAIATIYLVQLVLSMVGALDLVASAASDLVVLGCLLAFGAASGDLRRLGLARARSRFVIAGVLVGISTWYLGLSIVTWLKPPGDVEVLEHLTQRAPLAVTLVVLAVLPPLAEEIVFRGVLARGLSTRFASVWAVLLSALVFGLYHMVPAQMIPTFLLGLVLAFLALRANSIVPTIIAHALNNTIAILLSRDDLPAASAWIGGHPAAMLAASLGTLAAGVALAAPRAA